MDELTREKLNGHRSAIEFRKDSDGVYIDNYLENGTSWVVSFTKEDVFKIVDYLLSWLEEIETEQIAKRN